MIRRLLIVLLALVGVLALILIGAFLYVRSGTRTQTAGDLQLAGLQAPVTVHRDEYGIPQIYAENAHDLFFAQGYIHAQDRLFQMDFQRRVGTGTLSEVLGDSTLKTDKFLRTLGTARAAAHDLTLMDADTLALLSAYADGVNAFINANKDHLPVEFRILGYKPAPWEPLHSVVWGEMMAWNLGGNWENELMNAQLIEKMGAEKAAELMPLYPAEGPFIIPEEVKSFAGLDSVDMDAVWAIKRLFNTDLPGVGSNDWVVAGSRTTTGMPLLADDPHLGMQIPSVWYAAGLHGGGFDVTGVSFPGVPGVVIGHNNRVAWGVTNVGPDVQDLFIEKINPQNPNQYEFKGQWQDMQLIEERIPVKDQAEPVVQTVRVTRHGPLLNDVSSDIGADAPPLALQWTALQGMTLSQSILMIDRAQNWDEFRNALRYFSAPSQNFVYADVDGNIGYQVPGQIPIRAQGDGRVPVPGWTGEYEWTGFIPYEELPFVYNPDVGYIATANNKVVPDSYPYLIATDWAAPYRARRIVQLIESKPKLSPDDFAAIHGDVYMLPADVLVPLLDKADFSAASQPVQKALALMKSWDRHMDAGAPQPLIYQQFVKDLLREGVADEVTAAAGEELAQNYQEQFQNLNLQALVALAGQPDSAWWDDVRTPETERLSQIVARAFTKTVETLQAAHGDDPAGWRWGDVHWTNFDHLVFAQVSPLNGAFNRKVAARGGGVTVDAAGPDYKTFVMQSGASYRQIVDLSNLPASRFIYTTGQSGNVFSRHYDDLIELWQQVQYIPMHFDKAEIEKSAQQTLVLKPSSP